MAAVWWESGGGHGRCPRGELRFACIIDAALAWPRHAQVCLLTMSCQPAAAVACTCRLTRLSHCVTASCPADRI